jgi:hypothetical protein
LDHPFAVLASGTLAVFTCMMNWTNFRGQTAIITVFTADGANISSVVMVPEFLSFLFPAPFMIATLLAVIVCKRKRSKLLEETVKICT